eukprot:scaffold3652_cov106-Isochrysis_galbana.AAC.4
MRTPGACVHAPGVVALPAFGAGLPRGRAIPDAILHAAARPGLAMERGTAVAPGRAAALARRLCAHADDQEQEDGWAAHHRRLLDCGQDGLPAEAILRSSSPRVRVGSKKYYRGGARGAAARLADRRCRDRAARCPRRLAAGWPRCCALRRCPAAAAAPAPLRTHA